MKQDNDPRPQGQAAPDRAGDVGDAATQEHAQAREAVRQMGDKNKLNINEGGRTQDSSAKENPPGAVHGLPTPALKGTWR
ncbi:MAG: hypothetical protein EOO38_15530 [Cytophagaceae bacterium]|nr:MAG: hypothetical protein EOO38_15530 [Cytophagaceae bacterium]